jgi:hypothetical protein
MTIFLQYKELNTIFLNFIRINEQNHFEGKR